MFNQNQFAVCCAVYWERNRKVQRRERRPQKGAVECPEQLEAHRTTSSPTASVSVTCHPDLVLPLDIGGLERVRSTSRSSSLLYRENILSSLSSLIPPPSRPGVICKRRSDRCWYTGSRSRNPSRKRPSALGC